jgi:hypothetical protein
MSDTGAYDKFIYTDGDELWDRIHQAHRRFAGLLSVTPSKHLVPHSDWTAGEIAGHLLTVLRRYTRRDLSSTEGLSPDFESLADLNDAELDGLGPTSVGDILDQVWQELADLEEILPRTGDLNQTFPFHGGLEVDMAGWLGNLIGEFAVHGRDVARSRGKPWKIGSRNAALALNFGVQVLPGLVSADYSGDLKVEIRTPESNAWILDLVDGELTSRAADRHETADVRIFARAEPLMLNRYGRIGIPQMTILGSTLVGGRRPWRLARVATSFSVV